MQYKKLILGLVIFIVIFAIIDVSIISYKYFLTQKINSLTQQIKKIKQGSNEQANTKTQPNSAKTISSAQTKNSPLLSYENEIKIYNGRRIQFSVSSSSYCSMIPASISFKEGTNVMLDNRSSRTIIVSLDGTPYNLKGYNFRIITLATLSNLPHTVKVNCGTGVNNGSIILR